MGKLILLFLILACGLYLTFSQNKQQERAQQQRQEQEQANQREKGKQEEQEERQRRLKEIANEEEKTKPNVDCHAAARARAAEIAHYDYSSDWIPGDPSERKIDDDHIELVAKDIKFQNGFGAWMYVPHRCTYNTRTKTVESVIFEE